MRKIIIAESQAKTLIKILKEQNEGDYYELTGKQYEELLKLASYNSKVTGIKKFGGKPLYIVGDVNLSNTPTTSLGNVAVITGSLNINSTEISSLGNTIVKGRVSDYGTPMEKMRIRREELKKEAEADERREDGEWDLDNPNIDDEGLAANALFQNLVNDGDLDEMDEETKNEIQTKKERYNQIQERYNEIKDTASPEELEALSDEGVDILNEIEELRGDKGDVYYIIPPNRSYRGVYYFDVIGLRGQEYLVGYQDDIYELAIEDQEQLIDDVGIDGISKSLIENNINLGDVREHIEEFYRDDITENPDVYFNPDDFELTDEQEERKEKLEIEIEGLREKLENTENEDEIAVLETEIEEFQEELDSIEPDTEPTDDMIEEKVNYYVRNTDEIDWLKEMGYELNDWVNLKGVATDIVDTDGIGVLARYDGRYDEVTVTTADGKKHSFVVMRMN